MPESLNEKQIEVVKNATTFIRRLPFELTGIFKLDAVGGTGPELAFFPHDTPEEVRRWARFLGDCKKKYEEQMLTLEADRPFFKVRVVFYRSVVCRKVVKGTVDIPARIVPAHTEEIIEWECDSILDPEVQNA